MTIETLASRGREILAALSAVVVGKAEVLERILAGIVANGHILIEDYPGLAKTLIARLFAQSLDLEFKRIQFTPDLLPATSPGASSTTSARAASSSGGDPFSRTCCSLTRSTARRPRRRRRSSRACRRRRSRSRARRSRSTRRSS
jgi:MoxR-like ATPase